MALEISSSKPNEQDCKKKSHFEIDIEWFIYI
jgi:hypothetical protein